MTKNTSHEDGFSRECPESDDELRAQLYEGELFILPATTESIALVDEVQSLIDGAFVDLEDARKAHLHLSGDAFFERAGELRRKIYKESHFHGLIAELVSAVGFADGRTGIDPARLRVVTPGGHENPAAAAMYYGHRDTWYANPQAMLTWWIPLHDVDASNSFCFFPRYFDKPVNNDSEVFNFERWVEKDEKKLIGWQDKNTGLTARYPQLLEEPTGQEVPVTCERGDVLIFSGQHLHRTYKHNAELTRFSIDFRTVDFMDQDRGIEARNTDNRSTGEWNKKFFPLRDRQLISE